MKIRHASKLALLSVSIIMLSSSAWALGGSCRVDLPTTTKFENFYVLTTTTMHERACEQIGPDGLSRVGRILQGWFPQEDFTVAQYNFIPN